MGSSILDKFSTNLKKTLSKAYYLAWSNGHASIQPQHLLWGLSNQKGCIASEILHKFGITPEYISQNFVQNAPHEGNIGTQNTAVKAPTPDTPTKQILKRALLIASNYHHQYVGTEHLLASLLSQESNPLETKPSSLSPQTLRSIHQYVLTVLKSASKFPDITETFNLIGDQYAEEAETEDAPAMPYPPLPFMSPQTADFHTFTADLTHKKQQKKTDPVIGRETEIERLIEILLRRNKNNPLLLGEPGVGKTAIVEGLAKKILEGNVPPALSNKKIYALNLSSVISGTMFRGDFEARMKQIIDKAASDPNSILFIDEIHLIVGMGGGSSSLDAANILKPALARGEIHCIGATTYAEYKSRILPDAALDRRFQIIRVKEPSLTEVKQILEGVRENYEKYHGVRVADEIISLAIEWSKKYIPNRFFPDKAIDLIDEAASRTRLNQKLSKDEEIAQKIEKDLKRLRGGKQNAIASENYDRALQLNQQIGRLEVALQKLNKKIKKQKEGYAHTVSREDLAEVVSHISGAPKARILEDEAQTILNLEANLNRLVIGQTEAMRCIASSIKRNSAGLSSTKKPLASFLFAGSTGVGKTFTAKTLAQMVFGSDSALIRLDMSEYAEKFNLSKLLGAPAGYIGYEEGGMLGNRLLQNPYSVILFDEIEKAHPDVFNLLLQIMDEGALTDGQGRILDFKNNIIILTTNIGTDKIQTGSALGFGETGDRTSSAFLKNSIGEELKERMRPELLNRLDHKIIFSPLNDEHRKQIAEQKLADLNERLKSKGIALKADTQALDFIASYHSHPWEGARNIERNIQELVETPLSDLLLKKEIKAGDTVEIIVNKDELQVSLKF
ncbi:MAG: ATP-dependent Clp protease ATP-binding subunit [Parcubacteria group bacterium]|nr:ATP-dependent Clp protease ATP-binding subunit [Parcubacteria group bacterium]